MIGRLAGRVVHEEATGGLILDVGGVGYELACPVGSASRSMSEEGKVVLFVHTNLRQDALELFGFCSQDERATFRLLVGVPNVGPRLALSVLNVLPTDELAQVIEAEDKVRLSKVPGVGKKTAERLVLELRGKLIVTSAAAASAGAPVGTSPLKERLAAALTGLGYKAAEAERAAKEVLGAPEAPSDLSTLLRLALKHLAP